jgi:hypothetical protein
MPRALMILGFGVGYPLASWLRFDRGAHLSSVATICASLTLFSIAAFISATRNRQERLAARRAERRAGLHQPATEAEWQEFAALLRRQDVADLGTTVQRGPLSTVVGLFPVVVFWLGTLGLLFTPRTAVPEAIPVGARGLSALCAVTLTAALVSLALGYTGWRRARARLRRESPRAV